DQILDLLRDTVGVRTARTAPLLDQPGRAAHLERPLDLVERVAVVAHDLAGLGDVAELRGELEQGELPSGTLWQGSHRVSSMGSGLFSDSQSTPGRTGWLPLCRTSGVRAEELPVGETLNCKRVLARQRVIVGAAAARRADYHWADIPTLGP